jgi:hypothetical protein
VDAAKLFQASKSIASKHITLRSQQFEAYQKTSTLAKTVKSQTDRVTLTAAAAIALYHRSNETAPSYTKAAPERPSRASTQYAEIPRRQTVERQAPDSSRTITMIAPDKRPLLSRPQNKSSTSNRQRHRVDRCQMAQYHLKV